MEVSSSWSGVGLPRISCAPSFHAALCRERRHMCRSCTSDILRVPRCQEALAWQPRAVMIRPGQTRLQGSLSDLSPGIVTLSVKSRANLMPGNSVDSR